MITYEQRLAEFAHEKRLLRLPRPVRGRADASCDACGSSLPRTLYTLNDLESARYFFVGDTCLKGLARLGAVPRKYGRESGQKVYESEMLSRAQELAKEEVPSDADEAEAPATAGRHLVLGTKWRSRSDAKCVRRLSRRSPAQATLR